MACGATTSTTTTPTTAEDESNALTSSSVGCGGEGCPAWRLQAELSRLQQEKLLLAYSHVDDQRRLHEHEVQLQLLEREVGDAQQDLGSRKSRFKSWRSYSLTLRVSSKAIWRTGPPWQS